MQSLIPYLSWIESQFGYIQNLVKDWSNINSFSSNLDGLSRLLERLRQDFACLNGEEEIIKLPPRILYHPNGQVSQQALGLALRICKRPKAPIKVLLAGHMDTVYPPTSSFQSVQEKDSSTWIGPGVTDMKGGLAILLITLAALERSPFANEIGWEVLINPDEEIGSPGSAFLFEEAAKRNQIGLVFEPSFPDGAFVSARKGSSSYSIFVKGKSSHVGRDFAAGSHAIYALAEFIQEAEKLNRPDQGTIVNVGFIEGGGPINIVPDLAVCRLNMRSSDPEEIIEFKSKLEQIALHCQRRSGISFTLVNESQRLPKPYDDKLHALFGLYAACSRDLNKPFSLRETGGVCDGNILSQAGLATLDSIGALGGHIHTHEEYLFLPSLVERAQLTLLLLLRLATKEFPIQEPIHVHV